MALDKLTLLDETVVNNTATSLIQSTATSTSNTIFTDRYITYKNKIINGNFDIWQRGTSSNVNSYLADRWQNEVVGTTFTASRQAFTLGQTSVPNEPSFFHRTVVSSVAGVSNYCLLRQPIESVRTLAGKTATLSFWAKADSSKNIAVEFIQTSGSGGSPSGGSTGATNGLTRTFALTSSWQKFTTTVSIPSISGYTLGTNNDDHIRVQFWFDAGTNFNSRTNSLGQQSGTFDIAQVQLEEGNVATPFEVRPQGLELSLCQRYFFKRQWTFTVIKVSGTSFYPTTFPVPMRVAPSSIVYSNFVDNDGFGAGGTGVVFQSVTEFGVNGFLITGTFPSTTGWRFAVTTDVSAEII